MSWQRQREKLEMCTLELMPAAGTGWGEGDTSKRWPCPLGCIQTQTSVDSSSGCSECQTCPVTASSDGHCHWADLLILFFSGFKPLVFRLWITLRDRSMYCALNITRTVTFKCTFRPIFLFSSLWKWEYIHKKNGFYSVIWSLSMHIRNATICKNITWNKRNRRFVLMSFQICPEVFWSLALVLDLLCEVL